MIAGLQGILESRGSDWVVVNVGGVSLQVQVPTSTLSTLGGPGERVRLHTHLHVREDTLALYGFATTEERGLFEMLIGVAGVGPRAALGMLSAMTPEALAQAIASENVDLLTQIAGVGKKMASRLVLELKAKLEKEWVGVPLPAMQGDGDVLAALTALGYSPSEVRSALSSLPPSPDLSLEDKIRIALQHLGRG